MTEPDEPRRTTDEPGPAPSPAGEPQQDVVARNGQDAPRVLVPLEPSEPARPDSVPTTYRDPKAENDHWRERAVLWRERAIAAELVVQVLQKHVDDLRANVRDLRVSAAQDPLVRESQPEPPASTLSLWIRGLQARLSQLVDRYGPRPGTE